MPSYGGPAVRRIARAGFCRVLVRTDGRKEGSRHDSARRNRAPYPSSRPSHRRSPHRLLTTNSETATLSIGRARPSGKGGTRERRGSTRSQIQGALPCQRPSSLVRCPVAKWSRCPRLRPPGGTGPARSCGPKATPARPTSIRSSPPPSNATTRRTSPPTSPSARSVPFLSSSDELGSSASLRPGLQPYPWKLFAPLPAERDRASGPRDLCQSEVIQLQKVKMRG